MFRKAISLVSVALSVCTNYITAQTCNVTVDVLNNNKFQLSVDNKNKVLCNVDQVGQTLNDITNQALLFDVKPFSEDINTVIFNNFSANDSNIVFRALNNNENKEFNLSFNNDSNSKVNVLFDLADKKLNITTLTGKKFNNLVLQAYNPYTIININRITKDGTHKECNIGQLTIMRNAAVNVCNADDESFQVYLKYSDK